VIYADTSALASAYLSDEAVFREMRQLLLEAEVPVITSEIARVEFAGAAVRAARAGRISRPEDFIDTFDRDCRLGAAISLIPLDREPTLTDARRISAIYGLSALNSIHVAVAITEATRSSTQRPTEFRFVTRDVVQAVAARAEGLEVV
jgi:predicted nucleic acid-binding protein